VQLQRRLDGYVRRDGLQADPRERLPRVGQQALPRGRASAGGSSPVSKGSVGRRRTRDAGVHTERPRCPTRGIAAMSRPRPKIRRRAGQARLLRLDGGLRATRRNNESRVSVKRIVPYRGRGAPPSRRAGAARQASPIARSSPFGCRANARSRRSTPHSWAANSIPTCSFESRTTPILRAAL
jgi:hypothetical protein